jgi:hypothetical protein
MTRQYSIRSGVKEPSLADNSQLQPVMVKHLGKAAFELLAMCTERTAQGKSARIERSGL